MSLLPFQAPAAFKSDAVYFSAQEWENLPLEWQREPYKNVLRGKKESLISLGTCQSVVASSGATPFWGLFPTPGQLICRNVEKLVPAGVVFCPVPLSPALTGGGHWLQPPPCHIPLVRGAFPCWGGIGCQRRKPPSPSGHAEGSPCCPVVGCGQQSRFGCASLPVDAAGILRQHRNLHVSIPHQITPSPNLTSCPGFRGEKRPAIGTRRLRERFQQN